MRSTGQQKQERDRIEEKMDLSQVSLSTGAIMLPSLWVPSSVAAEGERGQYILWREDGDGEFRTAGGCLAAFSRLASAKEPDVVAFVQTWGPLGLKAGCLVERTPGIWLKEGRGEYLRFARQLRSLLLLLVAVRDGQKVNEAVISQALGKTVAWVRERFRERGEEGQVESGLQAIPRETFAVHTRDLIAGTLSSLMRSAQLTPACLWNPQLRMPTLSLSVGTDWQERSAMVGRWKRMRHEAERAGEQPLSLELPPTALRSALILATVAAATSEAGVFFCDYCRSPYEPLRKPVAGDRRVCNDEECRILNHRENARRSAQKANAKKQSAAGPQ